MPATPSTLPPHSSQDIRGRLDELIGYFDDVQKPVDSDGMRLQQRFYLALVRG